MVPLLALATKGLSAVKRIANVASAAKATTGAIPGPAAASDTGNTAVGSRGIIPKVGNLLSKAGSVVQRFLPGVNLMKSVAGAFNDPEWWEAVPGPATTTNDSLSIITTGRLTEPDNAEKIDYDIIQIRPTIAEVLSYGYDGEDVPDDEKRIYALRITERMATQYFIPHVRKLINAVPLQSAASYAHVLEVQATLYAYWQQLKKFDYLVKHGQPYVPNLNDSAYPYLSVDNASQLQSTIRRLEEYLSANVRIPHTMCEYLAWRYGRIYKAHHLEKSTLVMYNVFPITQSIATTSKQISTLMNEISSAEAYQKANSDIYVTYDNHDYRVEIKDDSQCKFDMKEWLLRQNLDLGRAGSSIENTWKYATTTNPVILDAELDPATTFMASTVSTHAQLENEYSVLFPVRAVSLYVYNTYSVTDDPRLSFKPWNGILVSDVGTVWLTEGINGSKRWTRRTVSAIVVRPVDNTKDMCRSLINLTFNNMMLKAVDIYNCQQFMPIYLGNAPISFAPEFIRLADTTTLAGDQGGITEEVLANEHVYAFANLACPNRKNSDSYKKAEQEVASTIANTVEKMEIATTVPTEVKASKV